MLGGRVATGVHTQTAAVLKILLHMAINTMVGGAAALEGIGAGEGMEEGSMGEAGRLMVAAMEGECVVLMTAAITGKVAMGGACILLFGIGMMGIQIIMAVRKMRQVLSLSLLKFCQGCQVWFPRQSQVYVRDRKHSPVTSPLTLPLKMVNM